MEKIAYFLLPVAVVFKLFITKKETVFELVRKYLSVCFINNLICAILTRIYFPRVKDFDVTIDFFIKYSLLSVGIGLLMGIAYKLFRNFWKVKFEVVYEKGKK
ncbi:MAG: hypothetical protein ACI31M_04755 [Bacilli bacterium]